MDAETRAYADQKFAELRAYVDGEVFRYINENFERIVAQGKNDLERAIWLCFNIAGMLIDQRDDPDKARRILGDAWIAGQSKKLNDELDEITSEGAKDGYERSLRELRRRAQTPYDPRLDDAQEPPPTDGR